MNNTFSDEVKILIANAQNGYCKVEKCFVRIHSIHHMLNNIKSNRKKFPLFIHSPFNAVGLCFFHHSNEFYNFKISEQLAEVYEDYLQNLKIENYEE